MQSMRRVRIILVAADLKGLGFRSTASLSVHGEWGHYCDLGVTSNMDPRGSIRASFLSRYSPPVCGLPWVLNGTFG